MGNLNLQNLTHKLFGDRRDQRVAIQEAGFDNDVAATAWAEEVLSAASSQPSSRLMLIATLRRARPDLTLRTATYIAQQHETRSPA
jgi:hypothetical protein